MRPQDLFREGADRYAATRPDYPSALFDFLTSICERRERAWDCATGSGQAARSLVERFEHVDATDVSPEQLAQAAAHPRIRYALEPAEHASFEDGRFDLVCVAQAMHWLDLPRFWAECQRVLRPRGVVSFWGYGWFRIDDELDALVRRHLLEVIEPYWAPHNALLWNAYRDVVLPFEELAVPGFALEPAWTLERLLSYLCTWSATRRCVEERGADFLETLKSELGAAWGEPDRPRTVRMDFHVRAARVP